MNANVEDDKEGERLLREAVALAESLRGANLRALPLGELLPRVENLKRCWDVLPRIPIDHTRIWCRARICKNEAGWPSLHDMLYPPTEKVSAYGRANVPGRSVLYASWNEGTVLNEIEATAGDIVQAIDVRVRAGMSVQCHVVGELEHVNNTGASFVRSPQSLASAEQVLFAGPMPWRTRMKLYVDSFMASEFRVPGRKSNDYKLTASFAELQYADGALIYPSVVNSGAANIAIPAERFDDSFEVVGTELARVERFYGHSIYDLKFIKATRTFAANGTIEWDTGAGPNGSQVPLALVPIKVNHVGWRKPPPAEPK